jgi:hypothetical protein
MTHIAIQEQLNDKVVERLEKLAINIKTDEDG